jgi:hypothetical protein
MTDVTIDDPRGVASLISDLINIRGALEAVPAYRRNTEKYQAATSKYDAALRETTAYMEKLKNSHESVDAQKEFTLAQLWSEASVAIHEFDDKLANRCFIKAQGWIDHAVWDDNQYKQYKIGIDDMRQALLELNTKQFAKQRADREGEQVKEQIPWWFPHAGVGFTIATFISLFILLFLPDLSQQKRIIFDVWVAFCVAASAAFLGGSAAASGTLAIPFAKDSPVKFSALGGIATFIVILILMVTFNR